MCAGLSHYVSPDRLQVINASIPKIVILTGDDDNLVHPSGSLRLKHGMPDAELVVWKQTGHALHLQCVKQFHPLLEKTIVEGRMRAAAQS